MLCARRRKKNQNMNMPVPKAGIEKLWINKEQYFDGINEEVWQYQICGY